MLFGLLGEAGRLRLGLAAHLSRVLVGLGAHRLVLLLHGRPALTVLLVELRAHHLRLRLGLASNLLDIGRRGFGDPSRLLLRRREQRLGFGAHAGPEPLRLGHLGTDAGALLRACAFLVLAPAGIASACSSASARICSTRAPRCRNDTPLLTDVWRRACITSSWSCCT